MQVQDRKSQADDNPDTWQTKLTNWTHLGEKLISTNPGLRFNSKYTIESHCLVLSNLIAGS